MKRYYSFDLALALSADHIDAMLKRLNLSHLFYVLQLPRKQRRRNAKARKIAVRYAKRKDLERPVAGPVLVVGTLDQVSGLGRSYRYEVERLADRPRYWA